VSSRLRVAALTVALAAALPLVSACDTNPGAAAIVGGDRITTDQLDAAVNTALADPVVHQTVLASGSTSSTGQQQQARISFVRQTLSRLIGDHIINVLAADHHVTASPAEVQSEEQSFIQQAGSLQALQQSAAQQIGVGAKQLNALLRITVLQQKLGTALTADLPASQAQLQAEYRKDIDQYDKLDIAQIAVTKQGLANRLLHKARAKPSSFGSLAKKYSIDSASSSNGGEVGLVPRSQVVALLGKNVNPKPGSFVLAHSSSQFVVLHIIRRQLQPLSAVSDQVKAALFASQAQTLVGKAIRTEGVKLGVHVSPRYGHWDNTIGSVVANKSAISSPAPSPTPSTTVTPLPTQ
jgi:parvulin-like peptidyl-prolyl isomerase